MCVQRFGFTVTVNVWMLVLWESIIQNISCWVQKYILDSSKAEPTNKLLVLSCQTYKKINTSIHFLLFFEKKLLYVYSFSKLIKIILIILIILGRSELWIDNFFLWIIYIHKRWCIVYIHEKTTGIKFIETISDKYHISGI